MALRLPIQQCLRTSSNVPTLSITRFFSTSLPVCTQRAPQPKHARRDKYAREQAKAKRNANLSRREAIHAERAKQMGDPIRGVPTSFVDAFDNPAAIKDDETSSTLNFFVKSNDLEEGARKSQWLLDPIENPGDQETIEAVQTGELREERIQRRQREYETAREALNRISNLSIGSSKDRLRFNKQRCVATFGRHNTDKVLDRDALSLTKDKDGNETVQHAVMKRAGPDTGSSEVQIGILTAKIRVLTQFLEGRGRMDKHNRRSLTLLVHKRQKLLKYLQRQDKGGARWQNLTKTLGLTDGTWKGEITVPRYLAEK